MVGDATTLLINEILCVDILSVTFLSPHFICDIFDEYMYMHLGITIGEEKEQELVMKVIMRERTLEQEENMKSNKKET